MIEAVKTQVTLPGHDSHGTEVLVEKHQELTTQAIVKKHKGMLPASGILPKLQKKELVSKDKISSFLEQAKTAIEKSNFDPGVKNILMLYVAFAQSQMDQNDKLEAGWMDQQQVQNLLLEDSAKEQKKIANESTTGRHFSTMNAIFIGLGLAILGVLVGAVTGGLGLVAVEIGTAALLGGTVGAGVAAVGVGAPSFVAANNPNAPGVGALTENGPDQNKLTQISILNSFWNLIAQKANQNIQTGTQLNIVNSSSRNTQQGQQAAQVIQEWGEMSRFQVAR